MRETTRKWRKSWNRKTWSCWLEFVKSHRYIQNARNESEAAEMTTSRANTGFQGLDERASEGGKVAPVYVVAECAHLCEIDALHR